MAVSSNINGLRFMGNVLNNKEDSVRFNGAIVDEVRFNGVRIWKHESHIFVRNQHNLRNINVWDTYFRANNAGVQDYYITFDNCQIGSNRTQDFAMVTGNFPIGSRLFIRLINNTWVCGRGGDGGSVGSLRTYPTESAAAADVPKHTGRMDYFNHAGNGLDGGHCFFNTTGMDVRIYLYAEGSTTNTGHIGAGGGGGGAFIGMFQVKRIESYRAPHSVLYPRRFTGRQSTDYGSYGGCGGAGIPSGNAGSGDSGDPNPSAPEADIRAGAMSTMWIGHVTELKAKLYEKNGYQADHTSNYFAAGGTYPAVDGNIIGDSNLGLIRGRKWQAGNGGRLGRDGYLPRFAPFGFGFGSPDWNNPKKEIGVFGGTRHSSINGSASNSPIALYISSGYIRGNFGRAGKMVDAPAGKQGHVTIDYWEIQDQYDLYDFIGRGQSVLYRDYEIRVGAGNKRIPRLIVGKLVQGTNTYYGYRNGIPATGSWTSAPQNRILLNGNGYVGGTWSGHFYVILNSITKRYTASITFPMSGAGVNDTITLDGVDIGGGKHFYMILSTKTFRQRFAVSLAVKGSTMTLQDGNSGPQAYELYSFLERANGEEIYIDFSVN